MAKFPSLPLFTDALIADTFHLDDAEFGRYIRLLMVAWRSPGTLIPNDPTWISKRMGISPLEYGQKVAPLILQYFTPCDSDAMLMQKRMRKEYEYLEKASRAGKIGAEKRWEKERAVENKGKTPMRSSCDLDAKSMTPTPTPTPKEEVSITPLPPKGQVVEFPEWLPEDEFAAFVEFRQSIKHPLKTAHAVKLTIAALKKLKDEGHDPVDVLNQSIQRGWRGLFAVGGGGSSGDTHKTSVRPSYAQKMMNATAQGVMASRGDDE